MTQSYIDQLVASATGDDLREIRRLGFSLVTPEGSDFEDDSTRFPQTVDWDEADRCRRIPFTA